MPTQVQFRRGTAAQNDAFTGAAGELSVNTDDNALRLHDGSTAGGYELAKSDLSNTSIATGISTVVTNEINVGTGGTVFTASTSTSKVGILSATPSVALDVNGVINSSTEIRVSGVSVLTTASNDALALAIALG